MNVKPGGKQNILRDTEWTDEHNETHKQSMVFTTGPLKGQPKGLRQVLRERGLLGEDDTLTARALRYTSTQLL
jgi:hypothetical protein